MFNTQGMDANIHITDNVYSITGKDRESLFMMIKLWLEKHGSLIELLTRSNDPEVKFEISKDAR